MVGTEGVGKMPVVKIQNEAEDMSDVGRACSKKRGRPKRAPGPETMAAGVVELLDPGKGSVPDKGPRNCLDPELPGTSPGRVQ